MDISEDDAVETGDNCDLQYIFEELWIEGTTVKTWGSWALSHLVCLNEESWTGLAFWIIEINEVWKPTCLWQFMWTPFVEPNCNLTCPTLELPDFTWTNLTWLRTSTFCVGIIFNLFWNSSELSEAPTASVRTQSGPVRLEQFDKMSQGSTGLVPTSSKIEVNCE